MQTKPTRILLGNSFPFSLLRRDVNVRMMSVADLRAQLATSRVVSFWGHESSRPAAEAVLGASLRPDTERPALHLTEDGLPSLNGLVFQHCYLCTPEYRPGFRPAIGEEVPAEAILGWHALRIDWI